VQQEQSCGEISEGLSACLAHPGPCISSKGRGEENGFVMTHKRKVELLSSE